MSAFELVAAGYFATLGCLAFLAPVAWTRRVAVMVLSLSCAAAIAALSSYGGDTLRAWAPHLYLVGGYWVPGLLARPLAGATRFEDWLSGQDRVLRRRLPGVPLLLQPVTELAYLLCYPLVPASFLVVWTTGGAGDVTRFWLAILVAGFACYVTLPWLLSRPPRLITGTGSAPQMAAINALVLGRVSHQLNTFPSGHVAVALAASGVLWPVSPAASAAVGCAAAAIAAAAAAGRYHYVTDVWAGGLVGLVAVTLARAAA